jgi:hypothetical protein
MAEMKTIKDLFTLDKDEGYDIQIMIWDRRDLNTWQSEFVINQEDLNDEKVKSLVHFMDQYKKPSSPPSQAIVKKKKKSYAYTYPGDCLPFIGGGKLKKPQYIQRYTCSYYDGDRRTGNLLRISEKKETSSTSSDENTSDDCECESYNIKVRLYDDSVHVYLLDLGNECHTLTLLERFETVKKAEIYARVQYHMATGMGIFENEERSDIEVTFDTEVECDINIDHDECEMVGRYLLIVSLVCLHAHPLNPGDDWDQVGNSNRLFCPQEETKRKHDTDDEDEESIYSNKKRKTVK